MKLIDSGLIECISCEKVTPEDFEEIVNKTALEMYKLIKNDRRAAAIAAPQVGMFKRFFVIKNRDGKGYQVVFNPVYTKYGSLIKSRESCLSYGLDNFAVVKRFKSIRLKHDMFKDGKLSSHTEYLKYPLSVIVQHETDHLNGRTIFYPHP